MAWLDRALLQLHAVENDSRVPVEIVDKAWDAKQCFVEAKDLRQCKSYEARRLMSAKAHRKGVKLFNEVWNWRQQNAA